MQPPTSYFGGPIDITGLVPDIGDLVPTTLSFTSQGETELYKQQQFLMQSTQRDAQIGLIYSIQPQSDAVQSETHALKMQSVMETDSVERDQTAVQIDQGMQLHVQQQQHMDTQLVQGAMGSQLAEEQKMMTQTLDTLSMPHHQAFLSTTTTQYSIMSQNRADQLSALEQQRRQQLLMLQQQHQTSGMTFTSTALPPAAPYGGAGSISPIPSYTSSSSYSTGGAGMSPPLEQ